MTRIVLCKLTLSTLLIAGISACNPLSGVHLNSQVLQGRGTGVKLEPLSSGGRGGPSYSQSGGNATTDGRSWASPPATLAATEPGAQAEAHQVEAAPVVAATEMPPQAASPRPSPSPTAPTPVVASAQSFTGQQTTVVGLGDPGRDGLWMETPLVSARRNARLSAPNGKSVVVTLEPISGDTGQGSRLSIDGMRALGLPLTELVELRVGPV